LLSSKQICDRGLFQPEKIRALVDEQRSGTNDWSMQIWQFLTLELWMQTFVDGGSKQIAADLMNLQAATA